MVAVADPGEAPSPPAPHIFRPNLGPKGQKKIAIRSIILSLTSLLESIYEIIWNKKGSENSRFAIRRYKPMFKIKLRFRPNLGVQ